MGDPSPDEKLASLGSHARKTRGELSAVQRLVLVQGVAERLARSHELVEIADAVVDVAKSHLGAAAVSVRVFERERSTFVDLQTDGEARSLEALASASDAISARAIDDPIGIESLFETSSTKHSRARTDTTVPRPDPVLESWAVLPLVARRSPVGMVALGWEQRRRPRPADVAMLGAIAHQCALAIDRSKLLEAERRERETLELLAAATRVLGSALDPNEVVRRLVQFSVPRLAPWCAVYVSENDRLERVAIEVADHATLADALRRSNPIDVGSDTPVAVAFRTGRLQVVPKVTPEMVARTYQADMASRVTALPGGSWCAIAVPVYALGRIIGVFTLVSNSWDGSPPDDVRLAAEGLAGRAGIALANARRFEAEHDMARLLAEALMPAHVPTVPGFSAATRYIPTGGPVAGDWFDVTRLPTGAFLVGVGDAAGHGVAATSLMALLRSAAQGLAVAGHDPAGVLDGLNKLVCEHDVDSFATALYGVLDVTSGFFRWSSAGHVPPLSLGHGRAAYVTSSHHAPLGLPHAEPRAVHDLHIARGEGLVLVTDGVVERRGSSIRDGMQRLADIAISPPRGPAEVVADHIAGELCSSPQDDCCIVVILRDAGP